MLVWQASIVLRSNILVEEMFQMYATELKLLWTSPALFEKVPGYDWLPRGAVCVGPRCRDGGSGFICGLSGPGEVLSCSNVLRASQNRVNYWKYFRVSSIIL